MYRILSKTVVHRCSFKKIFLKLWQNLQENTYAGFSLVNKLLTAGLKFFRKVSLDKTSDLMPLPFQ